MTKAPLPARSIRTALIGAVSLSALATGVAQAQSASEATAVDEVVVTGTRVAGRSRLDTLTPVDVISAETLQQRGTTELATQLAASVPALSFPRPSATDGTDSIRPASLRGQGPDQTLVLVNGVRRHATALVNVNGSVGRGSAAVDLNAIPSSALSRVEVLRDGASAQYGSDAIAGVINLQLREASSGGGVTATYGSYLTSYDGNRGAGDDVRDGETLTIAGWQGFALGDDGFVTVSAEYRDRARTVRSDNDPRVTPTRVTFAVGDPEVEEISAYINAGKPLGNGWGAYGWLGYQQRDAAAGAFFRLPTDAAQNPVYPGVGQVYPDGYLPFILTDTRDISGAAGFRGAVGGYAVDVSLGYGRNEIDFNVADTLNPSLGASSPTEFFAGSVAYDQLTVGIDASQAFDVGFYGPLNVAFGVEARRESYEIGAGEPGSYSQGPVPGVSFGSRGFTGFTPANVVDVDRDNIGAYIDLEGELAQNFTVSGALRYENYSDFGDNVSAKVSARYDFTPAFALRGAISSGFRAPSLQQQYYTQTSILYIDTDGDAVPEPYETGTYPSVSPAGLALGGRALEAETSTNYSLGLVYRQGAFELTADIYRIDVKDRIILSETLTGKPASDVTATPNQIAIFDLLQPYGASGARFFINGVDTETTGIDVVARYRLPTDTRGDFVFTLAGNANEFDVTSTPSTVAGILPTPVTLFGRQETLRFEEGTAPWKVVAQVDWDHGPLGVTLRTTGYGSVLAAAPLEANDTQTGDRALFDIEGRYAFSDRVNLAFGVDNLFDTYPRQIQPALNTTGGFPYSGFSPFGFNGRYAYARLSLNW
jgi:iron complex outermembrane receptor protein